ncbi:hypothetical protein CPB84DRAFT_1321067 [Gymnopilus junonius]|uniref:Uncharacterized protein n=1 Tax=Gymnopilus junonius TaxID=109634 RepID=A0A9P5NHT6_GYMJU|nr:hypothetical protein CPB84DRAFT_1321067 [Gymnopilus junonius]
MLSLVYLESGKTDLVFKLMDHSQQQVRSATNKLLVAIASGTMEQKAYLRDALLPRLDQASPLLREAAANCLSRSLANDLVNDGDFIQIFRIFITKMPVCGSPSSPNSRLTFKDRMRPHVDNLLMQEYYQPFFKHIRQLRMTYWISCRAVSFPCLDHLSLKMMVEQLYFRYLLMMSIGSMSRQSRL